MAEWQPIATAPAQYRWCNACQMNSASGCRHPLGPTYCPYRRRSTTPETPPEREGA